MTTTAAIDPHSAYIMHASSVITNAHLTANRLLHGYTIVICCCFNERTGLGVLTAAYLLYL